MYADKAVNEASAGLDTVTSLKHWRPRSMDKNAARLVTRYEHGMASIQLHVIQYPADPEAPQHHANISSQNFLINQNLLNVQWIQSDN